MNKRGLIKFILVFLAAFISFYFITKATGSGFDSMFNGVMLLNFMTAVTIFMYSAKDRIKKCKFVYDVILMLLMLFSAAWFCYFGYVEISCYFDISCGIDPQTIFILLYPIFLFLSVMFTFRDIYHKTDKTNDILTIIVSLLIIIIHLRYYLEPNFLHKLLPDYDYIQNSYFYVFQNYFYFITMYLIVLIHRRVNRV